MSCNCNDEVNLMAELRNSIIASIIRRLVEDGKLADFLEFAREQAKKDGMDTEDLMGFFDDLEKEFCTEEEDGDGIDWNKVLDIIAKTTGCKVQGFKGDKSIIISNEEMSRELCLDYLDSENVAPINLEHINNALKIADVKLEFIEAMNIPFDMDGYENICRFKVIPIE